MKKLLKLLAFSGTLITCIVGCGNTNTTSNSPSNNTSYETEQATYTNPINVTYSNGSPYTGEIADPSVIRGDDGFNYLVCTNGKMFKSEDGCNWELLTEKVISLPSWGQDVSPNNSDYGLWAPDITKVGDKWIYYYSLSGWGSPRGVGCAIADNIEGPYEDLGKICSGEEIGIQNCIDPQVFVDDDGSVYMVAGSFQGLYIFQLDETGTKLLGGAETQKEEKVLIAGKVGGWDGATYEGSYIIKKDDSYYYFGSAGTCCAGKDSTYRVVVGKADNILGPYRGKNKLPLIMSGNSSTYGEIVVNCIGSTLDDVAGVGHNSILVDDLGNYFIYYHGYSRLDNFRTRHLFMDKLLFDEQGYPYVENYRPSFDEEKEGPSFII